MENEIRPLRIIFMGTPDFAVKSLSHIHSKTPHQILGVVTAPDKPAGRGRQLAQSAVKQYALQQGLRILQPERLKDPDFVDSLKQLAPDVIVVVAFRMLPEVVWKIPRLGTFNLHASLLPQYRGAAPINWAIINGETETGVTTFFIDEKIDTGAILLQEKIQIKPDDTFGTLYEKLSEKGAELVGTTLHGLSTHALQPHKQQTEIELKHAPKLNPENTQIDWTSSSERILNQIRGLNPFPKAWTELHNGTNGIRVNILSVQMAKEQLPSGKIRVANKKMFVGTSDGCLEIMEIQLSGKRIMKVKELLNGYSFSENAYFTSA